MTKPELRRAMRARLQMDEETRAAKSRCIVEALRAHEAFSRAQILGLFHPMLEEPDVSLLWGKFAGRMAYPRVTGEALVFYEVHSPDDLFAADWHPQIREPAHDDLRIIPPPQLDAILIPGLVFTRDGHRLGRGGGFYDRLLAQLSSGTARIGVCFDVQLVDELPLESHDQLVDAVVTENGLQTSNFKPRTST